MQRKESNLELVVQILEFYSTKSSFFELLEKDKELLDSIMQRMLWVIKEGEARETIGNAAVVLSRMCTNKSSDVLPYLREDVETCQRIFSLFPTEYEDVEGALWNLLDKLLSGSVLNRILSLLAN